MNVEKKNQLIERIKTLEGLTGEERSNLLDLLRTSYGLVWEDRPEEVEEHLREAMPVLIEDKDKALTDGGLDAPNHVLIEGDNLEALTMLAYTHAGKIDVIYIDPPYNTGNKDFIYNDSFIDSEDGYRHSKWLSFMAKRLRIARKLLSDRGVIFISIDDNEQANLKLLCDGIFGQDLYMGNVSWQRAYSPRNDKKGIVREVEYLCVFSNNREWMPNKLPRTQEMDAKYKNPDNDVAPWTSDNPCAPGAATHQGMVYAIQHPFTGELLYPAITSCWRYQQDEMLKIMNGWAPYELRDIDDAADRAKICGVDPADVRHGVKAIVLSVSINEAREKAEAVMKRGQWPKFYFTKNGKGGIRRKTYLKNVEGRIVTNLWPYEEVGHTDEAKKELKKIFGGNAPFDTPKPTRLLERILIVASQRDSTILDFFAGSGTTLHAVMQLNAEDGGQRKCILVTNNENGICENVTYERNKRVIEGYTKPNGDSVEGLSANNLRYYRTDFVPRTQSPHDLRHLVDLSTDMLCIKEDLYSPAEIDCNGKKIAKRFARRFQKGDREMIIIYEPKVIPFIVEHIKAREVKHEIKVYVNAPGRYAFDDDFSEVIDKITLCAIPDAILQAYRDVLPKAKDPELPPINVDEDEIKKALEADSDYSYTDEKGGDQ